MTQHRSPLPNALSAPLVGMGQAHRRTPKASGDGRLSFGLGIALSIAAALGLSAPFGSAMAGVPGTVGIGAGNLGILILSGDKKDKKGGEGRGSPGAGPNKAFKEGNAEKFKAGNGGRNVKTDKTVVNKTVVNKTVINKKVVVVRPVRTWSHRPYYGTFVGGVALGAIVGATAVGIVPLAPAPNLCWYWVDPTMTQGYWDYCY